MYEELMQAAQKARENAYCPYSGFAVGAALLCSGGTVYTGCNVENSSYPLCTCAERVAFGKAAADGRRRGDFEAIAICGGKAGEPAGDPTPPCGACRQIMAEFCGGTFRVVLSDGVYTFDELLPKRFTL